MYGRVGKVARCLVLDAVGQRGEEHEAAKNIKVNNPVRRSPSGLGPDMKLSCMLYERHLATPAMDFPIKSRVLITNGFSGN